jgi:hypothetical protein
VQPNHCYWYLNVEDDNASTVQGNPNDGDEQRRHELTNVLSRFSKRTGFVHRTIPWHAAG